MVNISDPAQRRWGFELTARLDSDPANGQAGDLNPTDANTQAFCDSTGQNGPPKPCNPITAVQFISHTLVGTRNGTPNGVTFEFDWTPPTTNAGPVTLYAAGNAANGDGTPNGDHIYTTHIQLQPAGAAGPSISSNGVINGAGFQSTIAPNSWVTIFGSNLAGTTRSWSSADIQNGVLPSGLGGTSVTINGKNAYVEYISAGQLNVLAPDDSSSGPVQVVVTTAGGASAPFTAQLQPLSPAFFLFDGTYLAATHADGTSIGKPGLFASAAAATTPAKPGETVILYGSGFGPTNPVTPSGLIVEQNAPCAGSVLITIGGVNANVVFAGKIQNFAGLYQFNVEVPATLPDGDQKVLAQINGVSSPQSSTCCFVTVQH